ncbi:type III secretion system translocon subunit SctE [Pseudomonas soli]|uniref:type III secretion system translocon subunit SctE n=1 Tax=Pseudomonas soli TaxID=1306993 RepID=UPI002893F1E5|nr:type III secretion system translocon subunit SctE [Pseudomonas soli]MDT3714996.1 type III secretion system translocon subunit SctE [Pseudomonas soli]MDT3731409.1 type III secretion system translocon subunit SctE [Pseudomonas soli]
MRIEHFGAEPREIAAASEIEAPVTGTAVRLPGDTGRVPVDMPAQPDRSIRLDPPLIEESLATARHLHGLLDKSVDPGHLMQPALATVPDVGALILGQLAGEISDAELDIRLTELLSRLGVRQTELNLQQVRQMTEQNRQQMALNAQKLAEVNQRHQDAGTASVFDKVFGWAAAIVSIVVGTVLVATGLGAVAGALMIAGGVMGIVSMSLKQAAEDGHISKEVMKYLGPVLMAVEVALALASVVLTVGCSLAVVAAKLAGKVSGKAAQVALSVGQKIQSVASSGSASVASAGSQAKLQMTLTGASMATATLSSASEAASSFMQGLALRSEAQLAETRLVLEQGHAYLEQLAKELDQLLAKKQQRFEQLLEMLSARHNACADIACLNVIA